MENKIEGSHSQAGFYYQNCLAASFILESIEPNSDIISIRLENDKNAKHIEDVIVKRRDGIKYYQVKWSENTSKSLTLYNLSFNSEDEKVSTLKKISKGYEDACKDGSNIEIILYTNRSQSNATRPKVGLKQGLTSVIQNVIFPLKNKTISTLDVPELQSYKSTLEVLRGITGLSDDFFVQFLSVLSFDTHQGSIEDLLVELNRKLDKLGVDQSMLGVLMNKVFLWSISGEEITKDIILKSLGISDRFDDPVTHNFKVDDQYYVENSQFILQIDRAINELKGGFIFIEGNPGTGKSTAIAKYSQRNNAVCFTYYCYLPEEYDFGLIRHTSDTFLKSMCIAIERSFNQLDLPKPYSGDYWSKLNGYLNRLAEHSEKIIFIIDGLDHVHKNTLLGSDTLLNKLTAILPENVYFILTAQYDRVLAPAIKKQITDDPLRHIKVPPFTKAETGAYIEVRGIMNSAADGILDSVHIVSGGIPLYLYYLTEQLCKMSPNEQVEFLRKLPIVENDQLDTYHKHLYMDLSDDPIVLWMMAIIAYRKEQTTVDTLLAIFAYLGINTDRLTIDSAVTRISHLVRRTDSTRYSYYHNSFREYVARTCTDRQFSIDGAIVQYYKDNPNNDESYRNLFAHLFNLGKWEEIANYVNHDWLRRAWLAYRPIIEIQNNLLIAWQAAGQLGSLSEFIRIGFLVAQVSRIASVLKDEDYKFPEFLLKVGRPKESLRQMWDGRRVLGKGLIHYALAYRVETGHPLPQEIEEQVSLHTAERTADELALVYSLLALKSDDIVKMIDPIYQIEWVEQYNKDKVDESRGKKLSINIIRSIINTLYDCSDYLRLEKLVDNRGTESYESNYARLMLARLYAQPNNTLASHYLVGYKPNSCTLRDNISAYCILSKYFESELLTTIWGAYDLGEVVYREDVLDDRMSRYDIHKDVLTLYDRLRLGAFVGENIDLCRIKCSVLPEPARSIYTAIVELALLTTQNQKLDAEVGLKTILLTLAVPYHVREKREISSRYMSESIFIGRGIWELYLQIFKYATDALTEVQLNSLVHFWVELYSGQDGYKNYNTGTNLALYLASSTKVPKALIQTILQEAERRARLEEETQVLFENLLDVSLAYNKCGFQEEYERIYSLLFDVSFGIFWRKDYRASSIEAPLRFVHYKDPQNSLERIADVLTNLRQFIDAARSRAYHISVSHIIGFVAEVYPELAFQLLDHEEYRIGRSETMYYVLTGMLEVASKEQLALLWALINTIQRWDKEDDQYFELCCLALKQSINIKDEKLTKHIIEGITYHATVEHNNPTEVNELIRLLELNGLSAAHYNLTAEAETVEKQSSISYSKPQHPYPDYTAKELAEQYNVSPERCNIYMDALYMKMLKYRRKEYFKYESADFKRIAKQYYDDLSEKDKIIWQAHARQIIRMFINYVEEIVNNTKYNLQISTLSQLTHRFLQSIIALDKSGLLSSYLFSKLDLNKWLHDSIKRMNVSMSDTFSFFYDQDAATDFISLIKPSRHTELIEFVKIWMSEGQKVNSLLMIARQQVFLDIHNAKNTLDGIDNYSYFSLGYEYGSKESAVTKQLFNTVVQALSEKDKQFARVFLLNSFRIQTGGHDEFIHTGFKALAEYVHLYEDENVFIEYFNANFRYNLELAKGIPFKEVDYEFVRQFTPIATYSEAVLTYLVSLFDYPVVKTRHAAMRALYNLIVTYPDYLTSFMHILTGKEMYDSNHIEHGLSILHALSLTSPILLVQCKTELLRLSEAHHFNIAQTAKEILQEVDKTQSCLSDDDKKTLNRVNNISVIIQPKTYISQIPTRQFINSIYLYNIMEDIALTESEELGIDSSSIYDDVYNDLIVRGGFTEHQGEDDQRIHRRYNINSNYDTIEINTPYNDFMRSSINRVFQDRVKRGDYTPSFIHGMRRKLRQYDPATIIFNNSKRPTYVNWLPAEDQPEASYLEYSDIETLHTKFVGRHPDSLTIYESGSQRSLTDNSNHWTTLFTVFAFLAEEGYTKTMFDQEHHFPLDTPNNLYCHEVPFLFRKSSTFPNGRAKPILGASENAFRDEDDLSLPMLLPDIQVEGAVNSLYEIRARKDGDLQLSRWQDPYTRFGRRRFKPISEGVSLIVLRRVLEDYINKSGLVLHYYYNIERAKGSSYSRTTEMQRSKQEFIFPVDLANFG